MVYSDRAISHLKRRGYCVYLRLSLASVAARANNIDFRGLVRAPGQTLADLYAIRAPLYERYADLTVDCEGLHQEAVVRKLQQELAHS